MRISGYDCPPPRYRQRRISGWLGLTLCGVVITSGCAVPAASNATRPPATPPATVVERSPVVERQSGYWTDAEYLAYMRTLSVADAKVSKNLYQQANDEYHKLQTSHTRLRLALTLSLLDPPYGDTDKSIQLFKRLLSPDTSKPYEETLPPSLESIVHIRLSELERYQALESENSQLQEELNKAKTKIQALTTIERTLEQPTPETKKKTAP